MNRFYFLHLLFYLTLFFISCSSKPEPVPITKKKIRVPSWINGISSDYKKLYGVGQGNEWAPMEKPRRPQLGPPMVLLKSPHGNFLGRRIS